MPNRRDAWTLIETLVAMLVVGLLMGILLPSIAGSIASARRVHCVAAIRAYSQSVQTYANDESDFLPSYPRVTPDETYTWPAGPPQVRFSLPYGGFGQVHYSAQGWYSIYALLERDYMPYEAALCPSQAQAPDADLTGQITSPSDSNPNYAIPEVYYFSPRVYGTEDRLPPIVSPFRTQRLSDVRYPSNKSLVFEVRVWHLRDDPSLHDALRSGRSGSIATADGRALSWSLASPLVSCTNHALGYQYPAPWLNPDGILGQDIKSDKEP